MLSLSERHLKRFFVLSEEPLPRSVTKCEAFAALPPLPKTKIEFSPSSACLNASIARVMSLESIVSMADFYSGLHSA